MNYIGSFKCDVAFPEFLVDGSKSRKSRTKCEGV